MQYILSGLVVFILTTQSLWGATHEETSAAGVRLTTSPVVLHRNPLGAAGGALDARIPIILRADAVEFYNAYRAMPTLVSNPYHRFFTILFNRYFQGTQGEYPVDLTKAILKKHTAEYEYYVKFSGVRELKTASNADRKDAEWIATKNAAHKAFKEALDAKFRDMPTNPYYRFILAALRLQEEPTKALGNLETRASELVFFGIRSLDNRMVADSLREYHRDVTNISDSEALVYLKRYHQRMYVHRNKKDFVKFTFYVPKVLDALRWEDYKLALFNEFNGLIAGNLQAKKKYHQKKFPDLKDILWRAGAGAIAGFLSSVRPTFVDVSSLVPATYPLVNNSSGLITNTTSNSTFHNETQAFNTHQSLLITIDSQRTNFMLIAAAGGALASVFGGALYNYLFCPPLFRLEDDDYATEINLLSAYCAEQVVQRYGHAWDRARSSLIAERVADVVLHDSIGFRKYIHNKVRCKKSRLSFAEIFQAYGKLPTTVFEDYGVLKDLFTL